MTTTANMGLSLPSPGVDEGPGWAEHVLFAADVYWRREPW